jgi:hypothetical protein
MSLGHYSDAKAVTSVLELQEVSAPIVTKLENKLGSGIPITQPEHGAHGM